MELEKLIQEIYWTIGRADPTDADLRGSAKNCAALIEHYAPELALDMANKMNWTIPLFPNSSLSNKGKDMR